MYCAAAVLPLMAKRQGKPQTPAYRQAYREAHKADIQAYMKRYYRENKENHLAWMRKNRCRRYCLTGQTATQTGTRQLLCNLWKEMQTAN